jgi:3'-5' exoribonuclease
MEQYRKKRSIASLCECDHVDDVFVVKIKRGFSPYVKGYRFTLLLSDNTGKTLEYVYWGGQSEETVKALYDTIKSDSVVHVQGKVSSYGGKLQLATNEPDLIEVLSDEQFCTEDFVPVSRKNLEELYRRVEAAIETVENHHVKALLERFFKNPEIAGHFKRHPGAISIHHNWIGGLLEHSLEVLDYCEAAARQFPSLDRDLLVAGALLHDIGKLDELVVTSRIKGTTVGQLVGHLVTGVLWVAREMDGIEGFDPELKNKLMHILVAHHGKNEYASPKEPMFPEAVAVYYADELSSKLAEMIAFIDDARTETEDEFMYHPRHRKNIYLK